MKDHGIEKQISTPYTPQQNGTVERANHIIVEMTRNIFHAKNMDKSFWAETVVNAVYTRNRCRTRALDSIMPEKTWSKRRPCIAHIRVFACIAYAMMLDEQKGKFDANDTKCLFLDYCEETKAYKPICLQTKKIIKNRNVVFIEDGTSVGNVFEIRPSERNEGPTVVLVDESSKSSYCDDGEEREEQVDDYLVANEEAFEIPVENDGRSERFGNDGIYPKRVQHPPGEWWKNHILPQHGEEHASVVLLDDPLNLCKTLRSKNVSKWEAAMQEEYHSLMANNT